MAEGDASRRSPYRAAALERLRSPEELEGLMRVVGPSGWAIGAALAIVVAGALYWSVFGRVATVVTGRGILGPSFGEVRNLVASHDGVLRELDVALGQPVKKGDRLGSVEISAAMEAKRDAERTLRLLQSEEERLIAYWEAYQAQQTASLDKQAADLDKQIQSARDSVTGRQKILDGLLDLQKRGFTTDVNVETAREAVAEMKTALAQTRLQREKLETQYLDLEHQRIAALEEMRERLLQVREQFDDAEEVLIDGGQILADADGRIVEIAGRIDSFVEPGAPLLTIQSVRDDLDGVFFVEPAQGKRIEEGMSVNVAPSIVEPERFGTIRAKVVWVTLEPQSDTAVARQLGNPTLAQSLVGNEAPIIFGVALERDPTAPSGLKWTSGTGPKLKIPDGTIANAEVAVKKEPPIVLVIPALRRLFGLDA
ncbi:NHLP bacteriocin system secretion protein [Chachezhania sediminis]|uniref:NHLP bacteriocin system secretion protein n=1 Tax=Chachezhania sediminis TaxID=2599291 RepID=UPI00131A7264|nr:NHLP bacteriocin system secretion protein [Chachezhania sediminis]